MSKKILVVLDPGHYPNFNRGVVAGYYEGDKMYDFTEYERDALKAYGIDVIVTRGRSYDMELYTRGQVAVKNGKGYDEVVFISNHSNAYNNDACGVVVFRSLYLPESAELGQKLVDAIVGVMKPATGVTYSRGVQTREGSNGDYYGVIRGSVSGATSEAQAKKGPVKYSFIVEHGFHDNFKECKFLNNPANLKKMAEAEAKVIAEYFGVNKSASNKTEAPGELYRVRKSWADAKSQIGAYKVLDNAKDMANKNPGYSVYNKAGECVYPVKVNTPTKKSIEEIAREVIAGKWGNGNERKNAIIKAGYNYDEVQAKVNDLLNGGKTVTPKKSINEVAKEVIRGLWGSGSDRKKKLTDAGYDYAKIQAEVNRLLK